MAIPMGPSGIKSLKIGDTVRYIKGQSKLKVVAIVTFINQIDKQRVKIRINSFLEKGEKVTIKVGDQITVSSWNIYSE